MEALDNDFGLDILKKAIKDAGFNGKSLAAANREAKQRVSRGEARDYGKTETRASSGWESSPFEKGGLVNFFKYGGLAVIL